MLAGGEPAQPPQQLSTRLSESRGGQGPARSSLGGPGWPSHRGGGPSPHCPPSSSKSSPGGRSWQSRKPSDFWARERADVAAAIAALFPHHSRFSYFQQKTVLDLDFPEPDYHKPERPSELDFSSGQNKRQGFVFNHNWNLNKF